MKKRDLLAGSLSLLVLMLDCWTVGAGPKVVCITNNRDQSVAILIPGTKTSLEFMQAPDAHVGGSLEQEPPMKGIAIARRTAGWAGQSSISHPGACGRAYELR